MSILDDDIVLDDKILTREAHINRIIQNTDDIKRIIVIMSKFLIRYIFKDDSEIEISYTDFYKDDRLFNISKNKDIDIEYDKKGYQYDLDTTYGSNNTGAYFVFNELLYKIDSEPKNQYYTI